jgi:hypothetical protein
MARYIAENSVNAYILYRELDFFEQLGALVEHGGVDFELVRTMLGRRLIDPWEMWRPAIDVIGGDAYPMFERLCDQDARRRVSSAADVPDSCLPVGADSPAPSWCRMRLQ